MNLRLGFGAALSVAEAGAVVVVEEEDGAALNCGISVDTVRIVGATWAARVGSVDDARSPNGRRVMREDEASGDAAVKSGAMRWRIADMVGAVRAAGKKLVMGVVAGCLDELQAM